MGNWQVEFRVKETKVDGKDSPSRKELKELLAKFTASFPHKVLADSLKVTRKASGGAKAKGIGSDYERKIATLLGEWWCGLAFRRTPNSGGWDKQTTDGRVEAPGDIFTPVSAEFPFVIECKHRNDALNVFTQQSKASDCIWDWWDQCKGDAESVDKFGLLIAGCKRVDYVVVEYPFQPLDCGLHEKSFCPYFVIDEGNRQLVVMHLKQFLKSFERGKSGQEEKD